MTAAVTATQRKMGAWCGVQKVSRAVSMDGLVPLS